MKAKNILMICLFISGLFCLPSKAQQPGENVSSQTIRKLGEKHFFSISTIPDDIFRLMQGKTYKKNCTVARSELRYIRCLHVDKDGRNIVGEMVVNKAIATDVLDILKKLYEAKYPIERMRLIGLLGCRRRKGDESQQLLQLQLPLHLAYPYGIEARKGTGRRHQHPLQSLLQTTEERQGSGGTCHRPPLSGPQQEPRLYDKERRPLLPALQGKRIPMGR